MLENDALSLMFRAVAIADVRRECPRTQADVRRTSGM